MKQCFLFLFTTAPLLVASYSISQIFVLQYCKELPVRVQLKPFTMLTYCSIKIASLEKPWWFPHTPLLLPEFDSIPFTFSLFVSWGVVMLMRFLDCSGSFYHLTTIISRYSLWNLARQPFSCISWWILYKHLSVLFSVKQLISVCSHTKSTSCILMSFHVQPNIALTSFFIFSFFPQVYHIVRLTGETNLTCDIPYLAGGNGTSSHYLYRTDTKWWVPVDEVSHHFFWCCPVLRGFKI